MCCKFIRTQELMKTLDMSMQSSKATLDDLEQKELEYFLAAEQCFERAIKFDSTDPEFLFHRGKLFFHQVSALLCNAQADTHPLSMAAAMPATACFPGQPHAYNMRRSPRRNTRMACASLLKSRCKMPSGSR